MPTTPHRFTTESWEQAKPLLNNNLDNMIQDLADLGADSTTETTITFSAIATNTCFNRRVAILAPGQTSTLASISTSRSNLSGISTVTPLMDVFVDVDNDATYLWPLGSNITPARHNVLMAIEVDSTVDTGSLGSLIISGMNRDSGSHTYYCHIKANFLPAAQTGQFR